MQLHVTFTGVTPLVMNNGRLADPQWEVSREIAAVTDKGKKMTVEDLREVDELRWRGQIYYDKDIGVNVPAPNIIRCLRDAAANWKLGKDTFNSVSLLTDRVPLQHDGPKDINALIKREEFWWRSTVKYGRIRIAKSWPTFRAWGLEFDCELITEELGLDDFSRIAERAGRIEGLGDGRRLGKGRFTATVVPA